MMPTNEELHAADKRHEAAIKEIQRQMVERTEAIERHEQRLERLDSCMEEMRATLATREDIRDLRADLRDRFDHYRQRMDALEGDDGDRKNDEKHAESMKVNWMMVAMFVGELIIGGATLYLMVRHG